MDGWRLSFGGALDEGRVGEGLVTRSPARRVVVRASRRAVVSSICSGRNARVPMLVGDTRGLKRAPNGLSVPPGSCVLRVCCSEIEACVGTGNDLLLVVKPSKIRVETLYRDLSCVIQRRFTLSVNGVKLMPDVFKKKLNRVGVFPGSVYRFSVLFH